MAIGFSSRAARSTCLLCVAGLLTVMPAAVARTGRPDPGTPGGPGSSAPPESAGAGGAEEAVLHRPGTQVRLRPGAPRVPEVSALSWVVADAESGDVLAGHDAHRPLPPASTLKTLFALTMLPLLPGGTRHRVDEAELSDVGPGSSLVGVVEGGTYRVSDLWNGVFLNSGNDAVHVLAALGGGWSETVARMRARARALGALDTHVLSPDGYDAPGQVSSAYDLAVFGRAGLRDPDFARYCAKVDAYFPDGGGSSFGIRNTNRLLTGEDGVEPYPGLIGIKNGYTSNAGNTLVTAARRDGRTLVVTVMNPQEGGGYAVYEEARALLDWGFRAAGRVDPVGSLDPGGVRAASPQPGPTAVPPAVAAPEHRSGTAWAEAGMVTGAAGIGAGALVLARRRRQDPGDGA
ncbi:D-alanyl-D-alanine carboxypeptidase family protein [Streptomyces tagetis]|uniref:D-alanyl-D-alanine carboxypeptidase n=1 Tax=Streptomyces tagetis TaxID=2820809 RepID=A0A940XHT9_9ACTN|nr:D-alanyl-D-alanine carboxypeptidase [Streptomyces sp. RG38]MBQ0826821.1 D-alanyl-D-alanine carboxypeptidase [Streptomyces sp. RG38]